MAINLELVSNSLIGGNIVAILARTALRMKARAASLKFRAQIANLQRRGGEMEYHPPDVALACIPISVKKQEAYSYRADVTQHSVESGANMADHIILQPVRMDVSFEITNWDLSHSQQTHDLFVKRMNERIPMDLQTLHSIIPNMILTSYSAENSMPNWGALDCRASFIQVKFLDISAEKMPEETVTPTPNTGGPDASKSASTEKRKGLQTPKDIVPD